MKLLSGVLISSCYGHGRLMNPPARSSLKKFRNDPAIAPFWDNIVPNYQDHELFCGGFATQVDNDYKCGVCGDNYVDTRPRANELGGKYGSHGIIPRTYSSGSLVDVEVQVTAHHQGFFQFKLCKMEKNMATEDEKCFDSADSIVPFVDGSIKFSITNYFPESSKKSGYWYSMQIKLPDQLECDHCVLQWRYHTGNSWGTDENGSGIGFGYQEEFYGCADIEIISTSLPPKSTTKKSIATTSMSSTTSKTPTIMSQTTTSTSEAPTEASTEALPSEAPTVAPTSETPKKTRPKSPSSDFCSDQDDGVYAHDKDCSLFYHCSHGQTYEKECPEASNSTRLQFNQDAKTCDWPINVNCLL